jgi:hypothetical protein
MCLLIRLLHCDAKAALPLPRAKGVVGDEMCAVRADDWGNCVKLDIQQTECNKFE